MSIFYRFIRPNSLNLVSKQGLVDAQSLGWMIARLQIAVAVASICIQCSQENARIGERSLPVSQTDGRSFNSCSVCEERFSSSVAAWLTYHLSDLRRLSGSVTV
jgi:hypothetical protein